MIIGVNDLEVHRLLKLKTKVRLQDIVETGKHIEYVKNTTSSKDIGVYVHIPFCRSVCMFCPYLREILRDRVLLEKYLNALLKEIKIYGKVLEDKELNVIELHVGGGTPSLVPPAFYKKLVDELSSCFNVKTYIAIEVNPEDLKSPEQAEEFYGVGVGEISIGVQSFDRRVLRALGRLHSVEDSVRSIENSVKTGFEWINVDLMFLPPSIKGYAEIGLGDKLEIFESDLVKTVELGVHQVTYYPAIVPKGSPGYKLVELNKLVQEGEAIDSFIELALDTLSSCGMRMTRVYSFSKRRYEYATVNLEMIGPLIGFGAGAWSNTGVYQYINTHRVDRYVELVNEEKPPALYYRVLDPRTRAWRLFIDQVITAGRMEKNAYNLIGEKGFPPMVKFILWLMQIEGFVRDLGDRYELTRRGVVEAYKAVINYIVKVPVYVTNYLRNRELGKPFN